MAAAAGWGLPSTAKAWHFYPAGAQLSACGKYGRPNYLEPEGSRSNDCKKCAAKAT